MTASGVLSLGHLLDLPVPCGKSHGCLAVAAHPSSKLFGVPIAFLGVAAYGLILALLLRSPESRWARRALVAVTGVGALVSAGLLYYSQTVIRATCPWCVVSGAAMGVLFVLSVVLWRRGPGPAVGFRWVFGLGVVTALALGIQAGLMQRAANTPPIPADRLAGLTAADLVDPAKTVGPADAPVTVVMFADLWCPACRAVHPSLAAYQKAHPDGVRLAFRHLPLEGLRGHEFSGAAAALSEIAAEHGKFWEFAERVFRQPTRLDGPGYLRLLSELGIDPAGVEARIADPTDPAVVRVHRDMDLAEGLGVTATPTFVVIVPGHPPVSANARTLPGLLNSPVVQARLAASARPKTEVPAGTAPTRP